MGASLSNLMTEGSATGGPGLGDIPESCVACVFLYLNPPEICNLARLNRAFRGAASSDSVWESKLPHNYQHLLELIPSERYNHLCKKDIFAILSRPVPFDGGNKQVWLDRITGRVCMSISARAMAITGIEDRRYWNWIPTKESSIGGDYQRPTAMILEDSIGGEENPKVPKKRAETWVQEETRTLISLRREFDSLFNTSKSNKHLWDQISAKMREKGFDRSPTMCTDKWRNLLKELKKSKQQPSSAPKMSYYKEIEEILRDGSKTTHFNRSSPASANMNQEVTLPTRPPSYTVFGYEDYNLQCTREHYRKKNIDIIIREESELKMMRKENQRKHRAKEKGKELQKEKGKEKENQPPNLHVSWDDIAIEWKRVHSTTSRGWRKVNRIFVTNNICWPWTLPMDSLSFQRFMYRRHGRA